MGAWLLCHTILCGHAGPPDAVQTAGCGGRIGEGDLNPNLVGGASASDPALLLAVGPWLWLPIHSAHPRAGTAPTRVRRGRVLSPTDAAATPRCRGWTRVDWTGYLGRRAGRKARVGRGGREVTWRLHGPPRWRPREPKRGKNINIFFSLVLIL